MSKQVTLSEMSTLSIGEIVNTLSSCYVRLIKSNVEFKTFPSVMLWGQPGVGKSQAISQIAKEIESQTGKKTIVTDVRLLLFNPIDLRGIPVASEDRKSANWLTPTIFKMNPSKNVVNILFLDEISAAPQSVQSAAYQITLDRKVGEHELPDNCIIIAAGNRVTDKSVAYKMPKALANRLLHFDVTTDFGAWKDWAIGHNIHPMVLGFLSFRNDYLNTFDASSDSLSFATPRSWEMVSNILNNISENLDAVYGLISGLIGSGIAIEFRSWSKIYHSLPKVEDIFKGANPPLPNNPSAVFALCCSMVRHTKLHRKDVKGITNSIKYASKFPKDYSVILLREYLTVDDELTNQLIRVPEFSKWFNENSSQLNGVNNGLF